MHDTTWIERSAARLTNLLRRYTHAVTINRTGPDARVRWTRWSSSTAGISCIATTSRSRARRSPSTRRGAANALVKRFEEIWTTGEPGGHRDRASGCNAGTSKIWASHNPFEFYG